MTVTNPSLCWWVWPVILFSATFIIGCIAPLSGLGGGVLFVPLATAFTPFNIDFIRGTGLILALTSALFSAPRFIKAGMANLRIMTAIASISAIASILGAVMGLWITSALPHGQSYVLVALGAVLFLIFVVMITSKKAEFPPDGKVDSFTAKLGLVGNWFEPNLDKIVEYKARRLPLGILCFSAAGFIGGMFGMGAGWVGVPVLNLVMGLPLKAAAATSMTIITVNSAAAAWPYIANGAMLTLIIVPSVVGISIGAALGARLALRVKPAFVRYLVIVMMLFCGLINIYKGLHGLAIL